jgi:hypothetical protein
MAIAQQAITTGGSTLYTSVGTSAITAMYLMNNHSGTVVIQLHVVPDGDSIATANKIIKNLSIAAGDTYVIDTERLILSNDDTIQATADTDSVVYSTISYVGV